MGLTVTQKQVENAHLILLVDGEGNYQWSATRSNADVAEMLRGIARKIEKGQ